MTHRQRPADRPRARRPCPALRAADQGVADALESLLSDNTRRVYGAQWRFSTNGATRWTYAPCRRNPSPSPVTWRCGPAMAPALPPCASP